MKRIKFFLSASAIFVSSFSTLMAQSEFREEVSGVGTNAANFLEIGVGARAMAMGGTYAAIANDPTALFYNPAGAAWVNGVQMELMHNNWLVDTKHDFVGIVVPLDFYNSALGLSVISLD